MPLNYQQTRQAVLEKGLQVSPGSNLYLAKTQENIFIAHVSSDRNFASIGIHEDLLGLIEKLEARPIKPVYLVPPRQLQLSVDPVYASVMFDHHDLHLLDNTEQIDLEKIMPDFQRLKKASRTRQVIYVHSSNTPYPRMVVVEGEK